MDPLPPWDETPSSSPAAAIASPSFAPTPPTAPPWSIPTPEETDASTSPLPIEANVASAPAVSVALDGVKPIEFIFHPARPVYDEFGTPVPTHEGIVVATDWTTARLFLIERFHLNAGEIDRVRRWLRVRLRRERPTA
jgi:hypothetical protein